jgi:sialic acid synthase SpsE
MEPSELKLLVEETERAWQALGQIKYGPTEKEKPSLKHRRSLYISEDMKNGDVFIPQNMRSVRPGLGLAPKYYETVLGKRVNRDVKKGTPVSWDLIG